MESGGLGRFVEGAALPCRRHRLETTLAEQLHMLTLSCWGPSPST